MVFNISYRDDDITNAINELVGKPYSLWQRLKKGGIGSMRMVIDSAHPSLSPYLKKPPQVTYANIELRPQGILVHLNNVLKVYAWGIPFHQLKIEQDKFVTLHNDEAFLSFRDAYVHNEKFFQKLNTFIP